jgi:hypothetical protein
MAAFPLLATRGLCILTHRLNGNNALSTILKAAINLALAVREDGYFRNHS